MENERLGAHPPDMQPVRSPRPGGVFTCLIVDDSRQIRLALQEVLHSAGIHVVGATANGHEAIELLKRHTPTAIILDLRLGESSGLDLARTAAEVAPGTAVILYTSYASPGTINDALAAGVHSVVFKQASPSRLLDALQDAAAGRPST
jgi:DNA-binding NarL/FixJ family response regulator